MILLTETALNERCAYTEHLCAQNRENVFTGVSSNTNYLRVIRVFYVINTHAHDDDSDTLIQSNVGLTSRAFMPKHIASTATPACDRTTAVTSQQSTSDRRPVYEEQKRLLERVNHWLSITGNL